MSGDGQRAAELLRWLAGELEAGRVQLPAELSGGGAPPESGPLAIRFPPVFGVADHRAPRGTAGLVIGGRTVGELLGTDQGLRWLLHMSQGERLRSERLRSAVTAAVSGLEVQRRIADIMADGHAG